jgi:hypothetical protein
MRDEHGVAVADHSRTHQVAMNTSVVVSRAATQRNGKHGGCDDDFHICALNSPAPLLDIVEVPPVGVERVVGFFGGLVADGHGARSFRIIPGPTAAKVNFARSSFGRLRMPSPSCANTQQSCARLPIGPTLTIRRSLPSLPHTGHRQRWRTSSAFIADRQPTLGAPHYADE